MIESAKTSSIVAIALLIIEKLVFSALRRQNQWAMGSATDKRRSSASLESLKERVFQVARTVTWQKPPANSADTARWLCRLR